MSREATKPFINRDNVDGPYIVFSDGRLRWLTLRERVMTKLGLLSAQDIADKREKARATRTLLES